ncbi:hypothetical protein CFO_g2064 [Ceratocystis platani]|uniref:Uncharacterized protein n=1 Tax=Ceratocystis fimbriata f. sp. platani TaxID=88771 RepID=A0A0F8B564_CERFI|nr:hypothetical protein CFO_g2064 [Ceratocystis platani]
MADFIRGGDSVPFRNRLSNLYNDTKKSTDFVIKDPVQNSEDPDIKALHRKLKIQKDRLVSWGVEWTNPDQNCDIDEDLSKAGLAEVVASVMSTIKDILNEAEPMWQSSRRIITGAPPASARAIAAAGDSKTPVVEWDKGHFENLVNDLTTSIDTLFDLSRVRSSAPLRTAQAAPSSKSQTSLHMASVDETTKQSLRPPQKIDPSSLTSLASLRMESSAMGASSTASTLSDGIVFMNDKALASLLNEPEPSSNQPLRPLLLEFSAFDQIYATTGIKPPQGTLDQLYTGLQEYSRRRSTWSGLPRLLGYFEDMRTSRLGLVYQFPPGFNPVHFESNTHNPVSSIRTLSDLLSRPDFEPPLEAKFRLAYNMAHTIFDMHSRNVTHGAVLDCNIWFGKPSTSRGNSTSQIDIRRPLISSFELFPSWSSTGLVDPTTVVAANPIYRHPLDPRVTPHSPLVQFSDLRVLDLYSLAVMLLSIGMWTKPENLVVEGAPSIPESIVDQLAIRCGTLFMKAVQCLWGAVDQELTGQTTGADLLSSVRTKVTGFLEACSALDTTGNDETVMESSETVPKPAINPRKLKRAVNPPSTTDSAPRWGTYGGSETAKQKQIEAFGKRFVDVERVQKSPKPARSAPDLGSAMSETLKTAPPIPMPVVPSMPGVHPAPVPAAPTSAPPPIPTSAQAPRSVSAKPKLRLYNQVQVPLPNEVTNTWNNVLMHQINHALKQFYRKHAETVEISLESMGPSPNKTKPVVLIVCSSVSKVKAILKCKLGDLFDDETGMGFGLKVRSGKIVRSHNAAPRRSNHHSNEEDDKDKGRNVDFQVQPTNGASISAWNGERHLPPVSFGGLVMVDEKPYGMTVHHMLDDPEQDSGYTGVAKDNTFDSGVASFTTRSRSKIPTQRPTQPSLLSRDPQEPLVHRSCVRRKPLPPSFAERGGGDAVNRQEQQQQAAPATAAGPAPTPGAIHHASQSDLGSFMQQQSLFAATERRNQQNQVRHIPVWAQQTLPPPRSRAYPEQNLESDLSASNDDADSEDMERDKALLAAAYAQFSMELSDSEDEYSEVPDLDVHEYMTDSEDEGMDPFSSTEPGDIKGVEAGYGDDYIVTQPAMEDVPSDFFPCEETADEDHLDTYSLGQVYASSGIRRRIKDGLVHEIDWALFEFKADRLPAANTIPRIELPSGSGKPEADGDTCSPNKPPLRPTAVASTLNLPGLEVQCMARTSGLQTGMILPTLTSVKIYGRTTISHSYQVSPIPPPPAGMNSSGSAASLPIGLPGDSGAWVIDRRQGLVCGHVLAWSQRRQIAYICPMDVLLLDIADTLGAVHVRLPENKAQGWSAESPGGAVKQTRERRELKYETTMSLAGQLENLGIDEMPEMSEKSKTIGFVPNF